MSEISYASVIGSIMYAMICTRPDVSFALSVTIRYQSCPSEGHWIAIKNVLKYLGRTKDAFLVFGGEEELVVKDKDDSRSQAGFVFCLNGGEISWKSSKQDTMVDFAKEAEYVAASEAAKEACFEPVGPYDNIGAIAQAKEPRSHQKSKHMLRRYHLIREIIDRGDVKICKVHTDLNVADPLMKPLPQS
ncbi:hypothetical protein U9M48_035958, partial [Paspalum notatum var. saurae]